jgi:hypothetical protein
MTQTGAVTGSVWTRFRRDASHERNLCVFLANDALYGTEAIVFRVEATVSIPALLGQLNYVIINSAYHKHSCPANVPGFLPCIMKKIHSLH